MSKKNLSWEDQLHINLKNLLLDLQKDIRGSKVKNEIGNAVRKITLEFQKYPITQQLKELYKSIGIDLPDLISHQELKRETKKAMKLLPNEVRVNQTIAMTEHIIEVNTMVDYLLDKIDDLIKMGKEFQIDFLKFYFKSEVKCFHKLIYHESHLQTRSGMEWSTLCKELTNTEAVGWELPEVETK